MSLVEANLLQFLLKVSNMKVVEMHSKGVMGKSKEYMIPCRDKVKYVPRVN